MCFAELEERSHPDIGDSVSDVIALLKNGVSTADTNPSSESSGEDSPAGEYEESDEWVITCKFIDIYF